MDGSVHSPRYVRREELLRQVPLLAGLAAPEYAELAAVLRERQYKRNEVIFHARDPGNTLFLLARGLAKVTVEAADQRELIKGLLYPMDFFGEMVLLDDMTRSATVTALEACEAFLLERDTFVELLEHRPLIVLKIVETLSRRLRKAIELVDSLAFQAAYARVARVVFNLSQEVGQETVEGTSLGVRLTQRQLANLAGTTRETTARVLKDFQQAGHLRVTGGYITVLEPMILAQLGQM
jgi:CRP-like cAMP-binding protein